MRRKRTIRQRRKTVGKRDRAHIRSRTRSHLRCLAQKLDLVANQLHEMGVRGVRAQGFKPRHASRLLVARWLAEKLTPGTKFVCCGCRPDAFAF